MHLEAQGPYPGLENKLALFGQFVGDWIIEEDRFVKDSGPDETFRGELHWRWVLEGRATQDVWMMFDEEEDKMVPLGSTIRFYDDTKGDWQSIWIVPSRSEARFFRGNPEGDTIVLESTTAEGYSERWVFYEIESDAFKWRAEKSHDDGRTWKVTEIMDIRRKKKR